MLFGGELDIPAVIARFTSSFPDVEVGLREGTARRMLEMLADGSLDVAFALEGDRPTACSGSSSRARSWRSRRAPATRWPATGRCRSGRWPAPG